MTTQKALRYLAPVFAMAAMLALTGCPAKQVKPDETNAVVDTAPAADENSMGDSDSGKAMGLQTVHFPYDSFVLDGEAKNALKANAGIMKDKAGIKIQIEGHCDQRGGIQYNIALGEKRANAVKRFMEDLGVASERITTISYGKERPVDPGSTEEAYAKNRRANFAVTAK